MATPTPKPAFIPPQRSRRNRRIGGAEDATAATALAEPAPAPPIPEPAALRPPPPPPPEHTPPAVEAAREPPPPPRPPDLIAFEQSAAPVAEGAEEEPVNENRAGRLPTFREVEESLAHPEAPPKIVGRYSAGRPSTDLLRRFDRSRDRRGPVQVCLNDRIQGFCRRTQGLSSASARLERVADFAE